MGGYFGKEGTVEVQRWVGILVKYSRSTKVGGYFGKVQ